jgi:NMD protein affecting ribosome stability and mRNA decay
MRNTKRYTNQTFTKRVDHEGGLRRSGLKLAEPAFCQRCGAIYSGGRWVAKSNSRESPEHKHWRPAKPTTCPACHQMETGSVGGYVSIGGGFLKEHLAEIRNLIEHEAEQALEDNPLSRIMDRREKDGRLIIETTTEHLAQRIGHALKRSYAGAVSYDFSHENKVARIQWDRD